MEKIIYKNNKRIIKKKNWNEKEKKNKEIILLGGFVNCNSKYNIEKKMITFWK